MIVACALAGIAARGLKIATGRARPSVKQELGWNGPRLESEIQFFPQRTHRCDDGFFRRALLRQPPPRALLAADPAPHRRVAHVCRGALSCRMWFALRSSGFSALGFASGPASGRKSSAKASRRSPQAPRRGLRAGEGVSRADPRHGNSEPSLAVTLHYHFNFITFARDLRIRLEDRLYSARSLRAP